MTTTIIESTNDTTHQDFTKTLRVGVGPHGSVFCLIKYANGKLSITGVEGPCSNGDCKGLCGQIVRHEWEINQYAPGWDEEMEAVLRSLWAEWHLNDMRSGCEHQRALGWVKYNEHPSEPCPQCGYKFGSAWLFEPVPGEVIQWLKALPNTDKTPNWI